MSHIIAGHFQQQDQAAQAAQRLVEAGFARDQISIFFLNPPGQHGMYPLGGDQDKSVGADESDTGWAGGATAGGAIGAAAGIAGTAVAGPLGPVLGALVGAHTGSLVGTLSSMKEKDETTNVGHESAEAPQRLTGMVVAVAAASEDQQNAAVDALRELGALQIEQAEGTIEGGDWSDFDPLSRPAVVNDGDRPHP